MVISAEHALNNLGQVVKAVIGIVWNNTDISLRAWFQQIKIDSPTYLPIFETFSVYKGCATLTPKMVKPLWEQKVELLLFKIPMGWKKLNRLKTGNSGSCK